MQPKAKLLPFVGSSSFTLSLPSSAVLVDLFNIYQWFYTTSYHICLHNREKLLKSRFATKTIYFPSTRTLSLPDQLCWSICALSNLWFDPGGIYIPRG